MNRPAEQQQQKGSNKPDRRRISVHHRLDGVLFKKRRGQPFIS
jgi:hypothetical protein